MSNVLLTVEQFSNLSSEDKENRLAKYLHNQYSMSQLNNNEELENQFSLLLKLQPELLTRFGKFIVVDPINKKVVQCCDDIKSALDVIYGLKENKESFIYQLPQAV